MAYVPSLRLGDIHSQWNISERKIVSLAPARLDAIVHDAMTAVTGVEPVREGEAWRSNLAASPSVFDVRALLVTVKPHDDGAEVEATMTFDASTARLGATMWLFSSIIGIPAGLAWRGLSIRNARRFARTTFDALWSAISRNEGAVYR